MKRHYDPDGLRVDPQEMRASTDPRCSASNWWFYEEKGGLCVCYGPPGQATVTATIPWQKVRAYARAMEGNTRRAGAGDGR